MRTNKLYLVFLYVIFLSCNTESIRVSDEISTVIYSFSGYDAIEVANDFDAYVSFSTTDDKIEVQANSNLLDKIIVKQVGNTLVIKLKNNVHIRGMETLNVFINNENITGFSALADASITLDTPLEATEASIELIADSFFSGEVYVDELEVDGSGDSQADLYGHVKNLNGKFTSDSSLKNFDLEIENLKLRLYGDSSAYLSVEKTIDIEARGDCSLYYKGDAIITNQYLVGDSRIIKR